MNAETEFTEATIAVYPKPTRPPEVIIAAYLRFTGCGRSEIIDGTGVARALVRPRHEIMWLLREFTHLSWASIGALVGGRDATTVVHGVGRIADRLAASPEYRDQMQTIAAYVLAFAQVDPTPLNDGATVLARRLLVAHAAEGGDPDVQALAVAMVSVAAILRSADVTDSEARFASQTIIANCGRAG